MIRTFHAIVVGAAMSAAAITQAYALNTRTWISGTGVDQASCGPITNPCRTLQYAHDNTSAGGEIDVKDAAGYGSVVITKAINIVGDGSLAGVLAQPGGNAITINAGASDSVVLRGLTVEGARVGGNGIVFNSGGTLTIANCLVQGFVQSNGMTGYGIWIRHTSGTPNITITGTTASYNDLIGIVYSPSGTGAGRYTVSGSLASHNGAGISIYLVDSTAGWFAFRPVVVDSKAVNNAGVGIQFISQVYANNWYTGATLSNSIVESNGSSGVLLQGSVVLWVNHVSATSNNPFDLKSSGSPIVYSNSTSFFSAKDIGAYNKLTPD